jgi:hypothetical protein
MVKVQHREPLGAVRDEAALEIFRHQWELYRKFLEHDYLSNAEAYARLRAFLNDDIARPFDFLDLACGDASGIVAVLQGSRIARYSGIDLAPPALALARENLAALPCAVDLEQADFVAAMRGRTRRVDIVWISLSLHHLVTTDKGTLMRELRDEMKSDGALLIYEPTLREGEDRGAYLDRFEQLGRREWTALSDEEFKEAMKHVRTCDMPESPSSWAALGREAGFSRMDELYAAPSDLFRMYSYRP